MMKDISSDEDDATVPEPSNYHTQGPARNYTECPTSTDLSRIIEIVTDKNPAVRSSFAISTKSIFENSGLSVRFTVYGCLKSSTGYFYALAIGPTSDNVYQTCTICNIEKKNKFTVCAVIRFFEGVDKKTTIEIYKSFVKNFHSIEKTFKPQVSTPFIY